MDVESEDCSIGIFPDRYGGAGELEEKAVLNGCGAVRQTTTPEGAGSRAELP
jgi:hypothetical protein